MPRVIDRTYVDCPSCDGHKLASSKRCRKCASSSRSGAAHPNYKGGSRVCACGGPKSYASKRCRVCRAQGPYAGLTETEKQRVYRQTPQGRRHTFTMNLKKFGITPEQYDQMLHEQQGVCAACGKAETHRNQFGVCRLAVDHNHDTGQVRGLLCGRCNRALGLLGDSITNVRGLLAYRERW